MTILENSSEKSNRSIVITDSGLGGLSVFSDLANRLKKKSPWSNVRLTYVNAWPAPHRGYNHFKSQDRKNRVFNNALYSMCRFNPDQILIACNTLSVIYPQTQFSSQSGVPVEGIVQHGIDMIYDCLSKDPQGVAVILGTPTTTQSKSHENGLLKLGISQDRILNTGCTNLAGWIERQPLSGEVKKMIDVFSKETGEKLNGFSGKVYAGLCCTHFGYKMKLFQEGFERFVPGDTTFLNPNIRMAKKAADMRGDKSFSPAEMTMEIVSQAKWEDDQINVYLELIPDMSDEVRDALKNYTLDMNLFSTQ